MYCLHETPIQKGPEISFTSRMLSNHVNIYIRSDLWKIVDQFYILKNIVIFPLYIFEIKLIYT